MFSCRFNFPSLHNWMDAKAYHDSIKPVRTNGVRPIGNRRKKEANIREEADAIICRLYETDVVTYHKDGRIEVRLDGWVSQSTSAFISAALEPVGVRHNRLWITATASDTYTGGWLALDPNEVNTFVRIGSGDLKFLNPVPTKTHIVNRKATNNVRRQYKPFLDYLKNVVKLRGDFEGTSNKRVTCSVQEYKDVFGTMTDFVGVANTAYPFPAHVPSKRYVPDMEPVEQLLSLATSTKNEDHYHAFLWLVRSAGYPLVNDGVHAFWDYSNHLVKHFNNLMLFKHRDECFDEVDTPVGKVVKSNYANFFYKYR
jgi:hypothetical protein